MRSKQFIILISALILPVSIFLFLKIFGKNEFDVPPLYQEGKVEVYEDCNTHITTPYLLPDSIIIKWENGTNAQLFLLNFSNAKTVDQRVTHEIGEGMIQIVLASSLHYDSATFSNLKKCILLLSEPNDLVLIDRERRIRGYYNGNSRDEVDRLLVEANIILKNY